MTLKIERVSGDGETRIRLSGELRWEVLDQVKAEIARAEPSIVLDLTEVNLIDIESVRFLNECQAEEVSVVRCSPYIREWMIRERAGGGRGGASYV